MASNRAPAATAGSTMPATLSRPAGRGAGRHGRGNLARLHGGCAPAHRGRRDAWRGSERRIRRPWGRIGSVSWGLSDAENACAPSVLCGDTKLLPVECGEWSFGYSTGERKFGLSSDRPSEHFANSGFYGLSQINHLKLNTSVPKWTASENNRSPKDKNGPCYCIELGRFQEKSPDFIGM